MTARIVLIALAGIAAALDASVDYATSGQAHYAAAGAIITAALVLAVSFASLHYLND